MSPRSTIKGPYFATYIVDLAQRYSLAKPYKTNARASGILSILIGRKLSVHSGNKYREIQLTQKILKYKLGELVPTRKRFEYKRKLKKRNKK
jgi:ribosomal protein S19